MNKVQTNQFRMFLNTQETLDANSTIWSGTPIIVSTKNNYDELIQRIKAQNEKTNSNSKAVTESKEIVFDLLVKKVVAVSGIAQAYASFNDDPVLLGKVKITKSELKNVRETEVEGIVNRIIDAIRVVLPELTDYNLTKGMLADVETTLDEYKVMIGQPRTIRNQAYAAMSIMEDLFDETNDLLKNKLDKLMIQFEGINPGFYDEFKRARTIVD